jgi:aspartyl-tRNA(Asn)/glutamyl-tRNA(Gln) amidotransferase subunit A
MELWSFSARELARGYRAGAFTPLEALEAILARIGSLDPEINAFATLDPAGAREAAIAAGDRLCRGDAHPLCGIPITVKDLIATRGLRTTGGSRLYERYVPPADSAAVERVRAAGAVIVGKTTTCEFGHKLTGDSALFGLTRNPHDRGRTSGGSSGGAAAGLAAGFGPLAIGTDAVGSIRVPAAFCGVIGLKPTYGLVPRAPGLPPSWDSLAHTGPMGRTIGDVAVLLDAIAGPDGRDRASIALPAAFRAPSDYADVDVRKLRIGFTPTLAGSPVDPAVALAVRDAVDTLRSAGLAVFDEAPDLRGALDVVRTIGLSELAASRAGDTPAERALLDPSLARVLAAVPAWSAIDYVRATAERTTLWRAMQALFERVDVLLLPTVPIAAFAAGEIGVREIDGVAVDEHLGWSPFSFPFNLTGLPALTIPTRLRAAGMPVGLQIVGPRYAEATLLAVGAAYERAARATYRTGSGKAGVLGEQPSDEPTRGVYGSGCVSVTPNSSG